MSILTARLREIAGRQFPHIALPSSSAFIPMRCLDSGELSSTAAVEIAKVTRQRAELIAESIISELEREIPASWRHDNGYIVCSGLDSQILLAELSPNVHEAIVALLEDSENADTVNRGVCCVLSDGSEPAYVRVRVVSRAILQALLAVVYSGQVRVKVSSLPMHVLYSASEVVSFFAEVVEHILNDSIGGCTEKDILTDGGWLTVWITHSYHDRLVASDRTLVTAMRAQSGARMVMPADGWLVSRNRSLSDILSVASLKRVTKKIKGNDGWFRFLMHAASSTPSADFDPAVALFDESASPLWAMQTLVERYERFERMLPLPVSYEQLAEIIRFIGGERKQLLRLLLFPRYTARAVVHGEVDSWCGVFEGIARDGHRFINAPATRMALQQGLLEGERKEIAAGLGFGLSCILPMLGDEIVGVSSSPQGD